jgi:hypothetical protein
LAGRLGTLGPLAGALLGQLPLALAALASPALGDLLLQRRDLGLLLADLGVDALGARGELLAQIGRFGAGAFQLLGLAAQLAARAVVLFDGLAVAAPGVAEVRRAASGLAGVAGVEHRHTGGRAAGGVQPANHRLGALAALLCAPAQLFDARLALLDLGGEVLQARFGLQVLLDGELMAGLQLPQPLLGPLHVVLVGLAQRRLDPGRARQPQQGSGKRRQRRPTGSGPRRATQAGGRGAGPAVPVHVPARHQAPSSAVPVFART